jgi:biotin operon repressor
MKLVFGEESVKINNYIKANYSKKSAQQIADELGITVTAVYGRANSMREKGELKKGKKKK